MPKAMHNHHLLHIIPTLNTAIAVGTSTARGWHAGMPSLLSQPNYPEQMQKHQMFHHPRWNEKPSSLLHRYSADDTRNGIHYQWKKIFFWWGWVTFEIVGHAVDGLGLIATFLPHTDSHGPGSTLGWVCPSLSCCHSLCLQLHCRTGVPLSLPY